MQSTEIIDTGMGYIIVDTITFIFRQTSMYQYTPRRLSLIDLIEARTFKSHKSIDGVNYMNCSQV